MSALRGASFLLAAGLLAAAGCASSEAPASGAAASGGQNRDTIDCLNASHRTVSGPQGPRMVVDQDRYQACMKERGQAATPPR